MSSKKLFERTSLWIALSAAGLALASGTSIALAATLPTVQASIAPQSINMAAQGGTIKVTLTETSGDLSACTLNNLYIGPTAPVSVAAFGGGHKIVATFNKSDLSWLPAFDSGVVVITGMLQCPGVAGNLIASATVGVSKPTTVQATVKPIISVGKNQFKDLNGNGQLDPYED